MIWRCRSHSGKLKLSSGWHRDGPHLPVEYARISENGRLTLVVVPGIEPQKTLWAYSGCEDLGDAKENLRRREGKRVEPKYIGVWENGVNPENDSITQTIAKWAHAKGLLGVVWTALPPKDKSGQKKLMTAEEAQGYLSSLKGTRGGSRRNTSPKRLAKLIQKSGNWFGTNWGGQTNSCPGNYSMMRTKVLPRPLRVSMSDFEEEVLGRIKRVAADILHYDLDEKGIGLSLYSLQGRIGVYSISEAKRTIYVDPIGVQLLTGGNDNYLAFWIAHEIGHLSSGIPRGEKKADEYAKKMLSESGFTAEEITRLLDRHSKQMSAIENSVQRLYSELGDGAKE